MHDLDRVQAESADHGLTDQLLSELETLDNVDAYHELDHSDGEGGDYEYDDEYETDFDEYDDEFETDFDEYGEFDEDGSLDEEEELQLAAEMLAATSEEELEQTVKRIVRPRPPRRRPSRRPRGRRRRKPGRRPSPKRRRRRRGLLGRALKGIAKKALPIVGGAVGSLVAPGIGTAIGAKLASGAGKAFGLELEGLSPEDQEYEVARSIVRLGAAAAEEADQIDPSVDDETAAKVGVIRASGKHAPGVVPRRAPRAVAARRRRPDSGRWVRRDGKIVILGL